MSRMVEISEEELVANNKLRSTVQAILANPKAKLLVQQATKTVYPNAITPELDQHEAARNIQQPIMSEVEALRKQITDDKAERENQTRMAKLSSEFQAGFDKLRSQGYTPAGLDEIRKIMEDKGILDHEIAAAYFEKQHPPQDPIRPGSGPWNFMEPDDTENQDGDFVKKLIETKGKDENGLDMLVDKFARTALRDMQGQQRR